MTVQGPVKKPQPVEMSHRLPMGGGGGGYTPQTNPTIKHMVAGKWRNQLWSFSTSTAGSTRGLFSGPSMLYQGGGKVGRLIVPRLREKCKYPCRRGVSALFVGREGGRVVELSRAPALSVG